MVRPLLAAALLPVAAAAAGEPGGAGEPAGDALPRAAAYLEREGDRWIEEQGCATCHRVGNAVWAVAAARRAGVGTGDWAARRAAWAAAAALSPGDDGAPAGAKNREGVAQLLLAPGAVADPAVRADLAALLRADPPGAGGDGWTAGGQLPMQRRPKPETDAASALWVALALLREDPADPAAAAAVAWADDRPGAVSAERLAVRLLVAAERDETDAAADLAARLRAAQNPDGGWGWRLGEESDALGAGLAVHALRAAGGNAAAIEDAAAIAAGRRFLVETQRPDGSWAVPGTKRSHRGRVTETASYWGTAWAALALTPDPPGAPDARRAP